MYGGSAKGKEYSLFTPGVKDKGRKAYRDKKGGDKQKWEKIGERLVISEGDHAR